MEALRAQITNFLQQPITWQGVSQAIDLLLQNTGRGLLLDPFENPDLLLWNEVRGLLNGLNLHQMSISLTQAFLNQYYVLQQEVPETRLHKGTPLQFLATTYYNIGQNELSRKYHLLAFIEDVIHNATNIQIETLHPSPASLALQIRFRMRDLELLSLQNKVISEINSGRPNLYPEDFLLTWVISTEKEGKMLIARRSEETIYKINPIYFQKLLDRINHDPTGNKLEMLVTYLFSCVDGFEPILHKTTSGFHFDVIIRNLVKDHKLIESLGEYIGIECKNLTDTVSGEQLSHFIQKLKFSGIKCGIMFSRRGISGSGYKKLMYGRSVQIKAFNRDGIIVFGMTNGDLERIVNGENLLSILLHKYEKIRFT